MQSIAVYSNKGGVGKSALSVFLADFLSSKVCDEQRVLLVDLDPQASSSKTLLGDDRWLQAVQDGKSLSQLLRRQLKKPLLCQESRLYLVERPASANRGKYPLQSIQVITTEREDWFALNEDLRDLGRSNGNTYLELLREALSVLANDFDICLLDFPAHDRSPITRCGLRAADRWLFPVIPDRASVRDLDGTRAVLRLAYPPNSPRRIKGLGTMLTICQQRGGNEYKKAKAALRNHGTRKAIPNLFSDDAELLFSTDAKNALDELMRTSTLDNKYGGATSSLYQSLRRLSLEIMERLHMPLPRVDELETEQPANRLVTQEWR